MLVNKLSKAPMAENSYVCSACIMSDVLFSESVDSLCVHYHFSYAVFLQKRVLFSENSACMNVCTHALRSCLFGCS